jgi:adenylate cyclase class 1
LPAAPSARGFFATFATCDVTAQAAGIAAVLSTAAAAGDSCQAGQEIATAAATQGVMIPARNGTHPPPRVRSIEERFAAINRERLRRIRAALNARQNDFIELLPLLFHSNHPMLPGYVSHNTPCGVRDFTPTAECLAAAQRVARSFSPDRRILPKLEIMGLYMMGSCGTIAYTPGSDFDIWLCHNPALDEAGVAELKEKAHRVEEAAKKVDLDVHFFVFDADSFRRGELSTLSAESSGSSQHYLLLDEFYRSAVVLAGLPPLWWRVPPEKEREYTSFSASLIERRAVGNHEYIDFGGLERVPAEEFFGAAVWHIYKSINSPYKSVLKLILIEAYSQEYPDIDLLAVSYKRMVYDGETSLNALDPYMLMYRKVEAYLQKRGDDARLELFRRCFYFKVEERLSHRGSDNWRREAMQELVAGWGWDNARLILLDSRDTWKVPTVLDQRRDLVAALTQSYRMLSQFGREQADSARISQRDLHILGRKLYAAFERKPGKIEIINRGIAPDISEPRVTLHRVEEITNPDRWMLFTGAVAPDEIGQYPAVRRAASMVDLLSWCHLNSVIREQSQVAVYIGGRPLPIREVRSALTALEAAFPGGALCTAGSADLTRPPRLLRGALFVNIGTDTNAAARGQDLITSNRTDPLSFGGLHHNLIECLDMVLMTSWEEVYSFHYRGVEGLLACLCEYLRMSMGNTAAPESFRTHCYSIGHSANICRRFDQLFADIAVCMAEGGNHWRYILEAADQFYAVIRDEGGVRWQRLGSQGGLGSFLSQPCERFVQTRFDAYALQGSPLPLLYRHNRSDVVQSFFSIQGRDVVIHVLDERGILFTQAMPFHNQHVLLDHLARFYHNTAQHLPIVNGDNGEPRRITFEFKRITSGGGEFGLETIAYNADIGRRYFQLRVTVETQEDGQSNYLIYCDDAQFTTREHGSDLFRVVSRHVLARRQDGVAYPIYITDIDVPPLRNQTDSGPSMQTARLLEYKRAIEDRFNQTVIELSVPGRPTV